jgi:N-acyl-phosphatidylethanolamine-hydrolysing phospholipase D
MRNVATISVVLIGVSLLMGCTTFGAISWRNLLIVLRAPDPVPDRLTHPARHDARLAATWIGHATVLVQLDDKFVLTDPVFTRYVGGVSPRLVEPGVAVEHLPTLDAALVSHRHFDHLSKGSLRQIASRTRAVLAPVGAGADIPSGAYEIAELSAWQTREVDGLRITAVPVAHSGDRLPGDGESHAEAFTGFVIEYRGHVVFFAGDTAFDASRFAAIAARFPAIDLALMPIGPIAPATEMASHHLNPAQALAATEILGATHLLPIHYDTFINSLDAPGDVLARFEQAARSRTDAIATAAPLRIGGQRVYVTANP